MSWLSSLIVGIIIVLNSAFGWTIAPFIQSHSAETLATHRPAASLEATSTSGRSAELATSSRPSEAVATNTSSTPVPSTATFQASPYYGFSVTYDPSSFNEFTFTDNANEQFTISVTPADYDYPPSPLIQDLVAKGTIIEKTMVVDGIAAYETAPSEITCSATSTFPDYIYQTAIVVYKSGQLYTISTPDGCSDTDIVESFASYFKFIF